MLNERNALYETQGKSLNRNQQNLNLTHWKAAHPELKQVHSQVLQNISERVELAFQAFFRRLKNRENSTNKVGYPRFKGQGSYDSLTFPQAQKTGCKLVGESLHVSKVGQIKCRVHRPLPDLVKTCTIRHLAGKWFACFSCESEIAPLPTTGQSIGIDVGLEKFASLSDGSFVEAAATPLRLNPRFFRRDEKAIAKAGRKQSKTKKG